MVEENQRNVASWNLTEERNSRRKWLTVANTTGSSSKRIEKFLLDLSTKRSSLTSVRAKTGVLDAEADHCGVINKRSVRT